MSKYKIIWSDKSFYDLEDTYGISAKESVETVESIINRADQLIEFPKSGAREPRLYDKLKEYRYLVEGNHKIIYRIEGLKVLIVRIFDTRQSPDKMRL